MSLAKNSWELPRIWLAARAEAAAAIWVAPNSQKTSDALSAMRPKTRLPRARHTIKVARTMVKL